MAISKEYKKKVGSKVFNSFEKKLQAITLRKRCIHLE